MKIADRLSELVAHERQHQQYLLPSHIDRAERQLRALLAVARAAESWHCEHKDEDCIGCKRVARALARLDRVSGERKP